MSKQPLFEENVLPVLEDVTEIFTERGIQYADTWRNARWLALQTTLKFIGNRFVFSIEELRTLAASVHLDTKYARLEGPWKEDTVLDLIPYAANWTAQMRKLQEIKDRLAEEHTNDRDYIG